MIKPVKITDVSRNFSDYLNRVAYKGEEFVLLRGNKEVAELKRVKRGRKLAELPAILAGLPHLSEKELSDLEDDIKTAKRAISKKKVKDIWA